MTRRRKLFVGLAPIFGVLAIALVASPRLQFVVGGALVNMGYRMQDHIHAFDMVHHHEISPDQIWTELRRQNRLAASVRDLFPRSTEHPVVALLVCMDARIDTSELVGDTRRYYYIVRTAGSALADAEQEMLELAVKNGVRVIVLTTHTDCAAEHAAADPQLRQQFPAVVSLVDQREQRIQEFMARPTIRDALASGSLRIERVRIDTATDRILADPR